MTTKFPIIAMTLISKVKVKYTLHLFIVRSAKISLSFPPMVLIFFTMIVYGNFKGTDMVLESKTKVK